jgi:UDP-N-acetylmuramate--alanine ligase
MHFTHNRAETQVHFVGIGGIGMSGIAEVFLNQGYRVSGSDLAESDLTRRLAALGARIRTGGHAARNIAGASVVVVSSAVRTDNPEVVEARRLRIPVIPRAEMLGELMRGKIGVAVAGTHGKTTTTSMLATILTAAGLDPTLVIGGKVDSLGGNAKLGQGQFVVAEADESDGSFLHLPAMFGIITNIDSDHLDHYGSLAALDEAFCDFVAKVPFYGLVAVCGEDAGVRRNLANLTKPYVTYGFGEDFDYSARDVRAEGLRSTYRLHQGARELGSIEVNVPGRHNVLNSMAAAAIALRLGIPFEGVAAGLASFTGVKRRFEIRWQDTARKRVIVDDYGHHPTEVRATLAAARAYWPGRIVAIFQPHRYSRTVHCHREFIDAFRDADMLLMTDIYAAGEDPIPGVSAEALCRDIQAAGQAARHVGSLEAAASAVIGAMRDGDLVLCLGAGSITRLPDQIVAAMQGE